MGVSKRLSAFCHMGKDGTGSALGNGAAALLERGLSTGTRRGPGNAPSRPRARLTPAQPKKSAASQPYVL